MARASALFALTLSVTTLHCGGCERSTGLADEGLRVWGRHKLAEEVQARAQQPIDAYKLDSDAEARRRVLSMDFEEVVARFGFLRLESEARFDLSRNGRTIPVHEHTVIEQGRHGSFRVVQKDRDEAVMREAIYNNQVFYIRNGDRGKMRVQGIIGDNDRKLREEAWAPLRAFTDYYGRRLGLAQVGPSKAAGRRTVRYRFKLLDGPEQIEVPGHRGAKIPISLSGDLHVDEQTGVAVKAKLRGELQIPAVEAGTPGELKIALDLVIAPGSGDEIKPESFVPAIAHRPVDLEPLRFLEADTRTSTVISGD